MAKLLVRLRLLHEAHQSDLKMHARCGPVGSNPTAEVMELLPTLLQRLEEAERLLRVARDTAWVLRQEAPRAAMDAYQRELDAYDAWLRDGGVE